MKATKHQKKLEKQRQLQESKHQRNSNQTKYRNVKQKKEVEADQAEVEDVVDFTKPIQVGSADELEQIEFTFLEPAETMYHSLKTLLAGYAACTANQVPQLADRIVEQKHLALAIIEDEQDDDGLDTVFSILGLIELKDALGKQIKYFFLKKCKTHLKEKLSTFTSILQEKNVCLMVNDRFVNLPPKLVPLQHQTFASEIKQLRKQKRLSCEYLLCISSASTDSDPDADSKQNLANVIYNKFEDYYLLNYCYGYWLYPDQAKQTGKQSNLALHFLISLDDYLRCTDKLQYHLE